MEPYARLDPRVVWCAWRHHTEHANIYTIEEKTKSVEFRSTIFIKRNETESRLKNPRTCQYMIQEKKTKSAGLKPPP
jgi:hypothetical protein